jgi:uncharacterized protein YigE (DUF2233 family)
MTVNCSAAGALVPLLARSLAVVGVLARVRLLLNRFRRYAVVTVDPAGKILKLAALAAEGTPWRLRRLSAAEHA